MDQPVYAQLNELIGAQGTSVEPRPLCSRPTVATIATDSVVARVLVNRLRAAGWCAYVTTGRAVYIHTDRPADGTDWAAKDRVANGYRCRCGRRTCDEVTR